MTLKKRIFERDNYRCKVKRWKLVFFIPVILPCGRRVYLSKRTRPWYWWIPLPGLRHYEGHLDHIYPKARGGERIFGKTNETNYQAACRKCNIRKSDSLGKALPLEKKYILYSTIEWIILIYLIWRYSL